MVIFGIDNIETTTIDGLLEDDGLMLDKLLVASDIRTISETFSESNF
jgi:hypothetical protein